MATTWDAPGLRWDRVDLAWDRDSEWLTIPYLFGPEAVAETLWLDVNFATVVDYSNAHKDASQDVLEVPHLFADVGLQTPTARLDANFQAVFDWLDTWPGPGKPPAIVPYAFRSAGQNTPLSRLDANFAAMADWWNPP